MIYIYAIYDNDICLYVGCTNDYDKRVRQHTKALTTGTHSNKSLQKYINEKGYWKIDYRLLATYENDSTLIKYFAEALWNSKLNPKFAKVVIQQGRSRVVMSRCNKELAERLLEVLDEYKLNVI